MSTVCQSRYSDLASYLLKFGLIPHTDRVASMMFAIIDLGSNSFKMEISRVANKGFKRIESFKTPVRFVSGIDANGRVNEKTRDAALACLRTFRAQLSHYAPNATIAVATESFRRLSDDSAFLREAEHVLGQKITVLSGEDEARYCYLGVDSLVGKAQRSRLVVDIGGGSTQFIQGDLRGIQAAASVGLGCVVLSEAYFADNTVDAARFSQAVRAAEDQYKAACESVRADPSASCVGASGAFRTVLEASADFGGSKEALAPIVVNTVIERLCARGAFSTEDFANVPEDRHAVFTACTALVAAVFNASGARSISVCKSGVRMGLLEHLYQRSQLAAL